MTLTDRAAEPVNAQSVGYQDVWVCSTRDMRRKNPHYQYNQYRKAKRVLVVLGTVFIQSKNYISLKEKKRGAAMKN